MRIVIVGAGVIGMMTAKMLSRKGHDITVIDESMGLDGCSFGNAGIICPSHFIPLASPGVVYQAIKWNLRKNSPFYLKPRINSSFLQWGYHFLKSTSHKKSEKNSLALNKLLRLSRELFVELKQSTTEYIGFEEKGCLMLFKTESQRNKELALAKRANSLGLNTEILSAQEVSDMELEMGPKVLGAVHFLDDCHLNPKKLMKGLRTQNENAGIKISFGQKLEKIEEQNNKVVAVITNRERIPADMIIVCAGAYSKELLKSTGFNLLLEPGRGYSLTYDKQSAKMKYPAILLEENIAVTPVDDGFRIAGTMEIAGFNHAVSQSKVKSILKGAARYYEKMENLSPENLWTGFRPCSPDGLPYIGTHPRLSNLIVATGHSMLGIALSTGTAFLLSQIVSGEKTEIDTSAFSPSRFI
jgi:D-amino-acid dehydrogenase